MTANTAIASAAIVAIAYFALRPEPAPAIADPFARLGDWIRGRADDDVVTLSDGRRYRILREPRADGLVPVQQIAEPGSAVAQVIEYYDPAAGELTPLPLDDTHSA